MNKTAFAVMAASLAALAGCVVQQHTPGMSGIVIDRGGVRVEDPEFAKNVEVVEVNRFRTNDGYAQTQVSVKNKTREPFTFDYTFEWFDKDGKFLRHAPAKTRTATVGGYRVARLEATSPLEGGENSYVTLSWPAQGGSRPSAVDMCLQDILDDPGFARMYAKATEVAKIRGNELPTIYVHEFKSHVLGRPHSSTAPHHEAFQSALRKTGKFDILEVEYLKDRSVNIDLEAKGTVTLDRESGREVLTIHMTEHRGLRGIEASSFVGE